MAGETAKLTHAVWKEIAPEIAPGEFNHPEQMDVAFLRLLSRTRRRAGVPFRIAADQWPGGPTQSHRDVPCAAVDLRVKDNRERSLIVAAALAEGFSRISIFPAHMNKGSSIHLDASFAYP